MMKKPEPKDTSSRGEPAVAEADDPFDAAYYDRFYESNRTRVHGAAEISHLARGVSEMIAWFGVDLRAALDVGAGAGLWRDWFRDNRPEVRYRSTDVSAYACERYGHEKRDIARWRARERYDLVICQGVLPYLSDEDCEAAIENLAAMSRGFLYLEVVTKRDFEEIVDREKTDASMRPRSRAWYRSRLDPHYKQIGCGLWYAAKGHVGFYEMERL